MVGLHVDRPTFLLCYYAIRMHTLHFQQINYTSTVSCIVLAAYQMVHVTDLGDWCLTI